MPRNQMKPIEQRHHDGHGLNDRVTIESDVKGAGGASHEYLFKFDGAHVAHVCFQHGAPDAKGSMPGVLDEAIVAMLLDRYDGFLAGEFACDETQQVHDKLVAVLGIMRKCADDRAARRVLQTDKK